MGTEDDTSGWLMGRYPYFRLGDRFEFRCGWALDDHSLEHLPGRVAAEKGVGTRPFDHENGRIRRRTSPRPHLSALRLDAEQARRWATGSGMEHRRAHSPAAT